jgi:hypothetical protein
VRIEFTVDERIRRLLGQAREAEARGESALARTFNEMARDLRPAPAPRLSRYIPVARAGIPWPDSGADPIGSAPFFFPRFFFPRHRPE